MCPECGTSVEATLRAIRERAAQKNWLSTCDPKWLKSLQTGMAVMLVGAVWRFASGFWMNGAHDIVYAIVLVTPWVLSSWAVWRIATCGVAERFEGNRGLLRVLRVMTLVMLCTPVLLIRPGDLRWGTTVLIDWWSPVSTEARWLGVLPPVITAMVLLRLIRLATKMGASRIRLQLKILLAIWPALDVIAIYMTHKNSRGTFVVHEFVVREFVELAPLPCFGEVNLLYFVPMAIRDVFQRPFDREYFGKIVAYFSDIPFAMYFLSVCIIFASRLSDAARLVKAARQRSERHL
jgi:hypothetical protein